MTYQNLRRFMSKRLVCLIHQAERGEDSSFEFVFAMVPIVIMLMTIAFAVIVRAAQEPAWSAASECARAAVATLDPDIGQRQGEEAARKSLAGNSVTSLATYITVDGDWSPDSTVTCVVSYDIDVSWIAIFAEITKGKVPIVAKVALRVDPYKSAWN
jgi:hypothetical protein